MPLKTESPLVLTTITAKVAFTLEFQPEMVPSSVAKIKCAGFPGATGKSLVPL
jgi:hypothetical protein